MAAEKITRLQKRKQKLLEALEITEKSKKQIIEFTQNLASLYSSGKISKQEYEEKLNQALENKTAEHWLRYYQDYLDYYNSQIEICNKLIKQEKTKKIETLIVLKFLILIVSISLIISLIFILKPVLIEKTEVFLKPEASEKPKIILEQAKILEETFNQLSAVVGKPVRWQLEFNLDTPSNFNVKLPSGSKLISVKNEQNQKIEAEVNEELIGKEINVKVEGKSKKFQIIYETSAPEIKEEIIGENKKLTITAPIAYSDIFSYTELLHEIKKEELGKLKLYQIKNGQRKAIRFIAYDTNENNLFDFIEFIAPETGEYELVIEISKAEHLDSEKQFISDIYEQVKALDENWSETIPEEHFVRVTFKQKLDNTRDITIYPRIVSGNPVIEVYEINGEEKIVEFPSLQSNEYNKVLLTNLQGSQDVFDLRVVNGSVEIEHIIDPINTISPIVHVNTELSGTDLTQTQVNAISNDDTLNIAITKGVLLSTELSDISNTATLNDAYCSLTYYTGAGFPNEGVFRVYDMLGGNLLDSAIITASTSDRTINLIDLEIKGLSSPEVNTLFIQVQNTISKKPYLIYVDKISCTIDYTANVAPQITYVQPLPAQTPIENSVKTITFDVRVSDSNGVNDINDNSVTAEFSKTGETTRTGSCLWRQDLDANTASYLCSVGMQYYDGAGDWNIKIRARDSVNNSAEDTSSSFVYQDLKSILISPSSLNWPEITPGSVNQIPRTSTIITNIGNHEGGIAIQAKNLYGETRTTEFISASSFRAGTSTGAGNPECSLATSTQLEDSNTVLIINSMLNKGPATQEEIFYCIPQAPSVSSQTYSTTSGSWIITVLFASIMIKKRKKKKQKSKKQKIKNNLENDNLIRSLNLLTKELKQNYSKEKEKIIKLLIIEIKKRYKLNNNEVVELIEIRKEIYVPLNIFKDKLGALEAITKYLKENLNMNYKEIAELLNRDERTIWTAYHKAKKKQKTPLEIKEKDVLLPISIFNKKLTILESIIIYLKQKELRYVEIANLLNRNQRNIWTIYSIAVRKISETSKSREYNFSLIYYIKEESLKNLKNDCLIRSLNLLTKELKQNYSKEKEKIIKLLIIEIKKRYKLNNNEVVELIEIRKEIYAPLTIFSNKLGALEAITKYFKENLGMSYHKIAKLLSRDERTIWIAYNKANQKQKTPLEIKETKIRLPISIFNKRLTILESAVIYLKDKKLKYVEIARLLNRNQRNIWTIYSRAVKKIKSKV